MCKILCDAETCKNNCKGICQAETISLVNHEYYDNDNKDYKDFEKCNTYEYDRDWMYK